MNPALEEMLRMAMENTSVSHNQFKGRPPGDFEIGHQADPSAMIQGRLDQRGAIAKIDQSYVNPDMQGQGVGRDMYLRAVQMADEMNRYLTSDRTVSDKAENVYQGMANKGMEVYAGNDIRQHEDMSRFRNDPAYGSEEFRSEMYPDYINNMNSMGGPSFAVIPPELAKAGGSLPDLLHEYMHIPRDEQGAKNVELVMATYRRMKAEAQEEIPADPQALLNDPMLKAVVLAVTGGGAGLAAQQGDPEMAEMLP